MTPESMQHFPLAQAFLCPDCGAVGNRAEACPACANPHILSLANVLDGKRQKCTGDPRTDCRVVWAKGWPQ